MTDLIEDYLDEVEANLRASAAERRQILAEMRLHLREKVDDLRREDPALGRDEAARRAIRDFGNPRDLALAYGPEGAVLKRSTGEVVLRVGRAVGRGTTRVLKWVAISVAALLVLGGAAGVWAFYEVKPLVEKNAPYPVYSYSEHCGDTPCSDGPLTETFFVHEGAREVRMDLNVRHADTSAGAVRVKVEDPQGNVKYERTFAATNDRQVSHGSTWAPAVGDWSITYTYTGFQGRVYVDVYAVGLPRGAT